jgi:serine/threonine-protein kinase
MSCPEPHVLVAFLERNLGAAEEEALTTHLDACAECRAVLAALAPEEAAGAPAEGESAAKDLGLPEDATWLPGDVIEHKYRIEKMLGVGGMGVVFRARHLGLDQPVALKVVLAELAGVASVRERLVREARAAAMLQSEHVARVLDVVTGAGPTYVVMELVEGTDLASHVREGGPMPIPAAVDVALQICEALSEAHALGLVHRDVKPSNVMLTTIAGEPRAKLLDFGLAKALSRPLGADASLTDSGLMIGSPHYMSPEQIRDSKRVDARTDLWAVGATLYTLLTAAPPFGRGSRAAVCLSVQKDAPTPLRERRPDAPEALERWLLRCLDKSLDTRVQTAAELAEGLAPFAGDIGRRAADRIAARRGSEALLHAPTDGPRPVPPGASGAALGAPTVALGVASERAVAVSDRAARRDRRRWLVPTVALACWAAVMALAVGPVGPPPGRVERGLASAMARVGSRDTPVPPRAWAEPSESATPESSAPQLSPEPGVRAAAPAGPRAPPASSSGDPLERWDSRSSPPRDPLRWK